MSGQQTPGPWEVGGPYPSVTVITMVDAGRDWPEPEPPQYEPVCYVHDGAPTYDKPPPPVALANARLIAAAPDLLAACIRLRDVLALNVPRSERPARDKEVQAAWEDACAAIAKAETAEMPCGEGEL